MGLGTMSVDEATEAFRIAAEHAAGTCESCPGGRRLRCPVWRAWEYRIRVGVGIAGGYPESAAPAADIE